MAETLTRGQIQDLVDTLAAADPEYRSALVQHPKQAIERLLNISLGSVHIAAVADTADTVHVVIPHVGAEGELSDTDLERVAIGDGHKGGVVGRNPGLVTVERAAMIER